MTTTSHTSPDPTAPTQETTGPPHDPVCPAGVGARVTASVMSDDYARILTDALAALDTSGLQVETGDVSTYLAGHEAALQRCLTDLAEALARTEHHASLTLLLSRGCPGDPAYEPPGGTGLRQVEVPQPRGTGRFASAEWALYPLADQISADGTAPDHMRDILAAIEHAKELGTFRETARYVTRLEGDVGAVIATALAGWILVGRSVEHVASHLTISLNSPSHSTRTTD